MLGVLRARVRVAARSSLSLSTEVWSGAIKTVITNMKKQVSFILAQKDLGPKRLAALPYLISTHGLRNYGTFLADPDQWIANLRNPAANFADQITGMVTEAKARVAGRSRQSFLTPPSFSGAAPSASGSQAVGCVSKKHKNISEKEDATKQKIMDKTKLHH